MERIKEEESYQGLKAENELLKDVLFSIKLTVSVKGGEEQILLADFLKGHGIERTSDRVSSDKETDRVDTVKELAVDNTTTATVKELAVDNTTTTTVEELAVDNTTTATVEVNPVKSTNSNNDSTGVNSVGGDRTLSISKDDVPRFYKKDILSILHEKNILKEELDNLQEELEEWKKAAIRSQEQVEKLEADLAFAQEKLGGYAFATELEANALGVLPRGQNFRPRIVNEATSVYVTDVEAVDHTKLNNKFVFSIQLTWSDKRRFEVYRGYGEFFTFQNTLLLLFPKEAGKDKSSERIIPPLPTADNVLAILGATNKKSIVESRLQLISNYCTVLLLNTTPKLSRSEFVKDFFKAKPGDKQLDSLQRPRRHSLELSVYPLIPEGVSLGVYIAIADFEAASEEQLSMKISDNVKAIQKNESGWWFVQHVETDKYGYVPASFLRKIGEPGGGEPLASSSSTSDVLGFVGSLKQTPINGTTEPESHTTDLNLLEYVAIDDYNTEDTRQVSFPEGAVLIVIEKSEDGWWFATYNNREGWVPSTYLEPCSRGRGAMIDVEDSVFVSQRYVTIQSYTGKNEDEISLPAGVKVEVMEKSLSGWWKVRYKNKVGYVPAVILNPQSEDIPLEDSMSLQSSFTHSISGIRKPPPRRKFLLETIEKKRSKSTIAPIVEEKEELTPPTQRRQSFKVWFNSIIRKDSSTSEKDSKDSSKSKTLPPRAATASNADKPKFIGQPRLRSDHISETDIEQEITRST